MQFKNIKKRKTLTIKSQPKKELKAGEPFELTKKQKIATVGAVVVLIAWVIFLIVKGISGWFDRNQIIFQKVVSVKIQAPFVIKKRETEINIVELPDHPRDYETLSVVDLDIPEAPEVAVLLDFIHEKESQNGQASTGLHVTCREKGMWNELGWANYAGFCFENEEQGMAEVASEINDRLASNDLVEVLCVYANGFARDIDGNRVPHNNCNYYQEYLTWSAK